MSDQDKTQQTLLEEVVELRQRVAALEGINAEREQAVKAARQSEDRLRRFYESGLLGVIYWNMNGQIIDANDKFLELVGHQRADLVAGRIDWVNMTPPEYRHLDDRSVEELKATGVNKAPFEKEYFRKDGTRVPIIVAGAMLDEARSNGVAFVLDITERKRAEKALKKAHDELEQRVEERTDELTRANEALRESERRFREMMGNVRLLSVMLDREGRITFCNDFLLQLTGWQREEVMEINWFDAFVPADQGVKDLFLESIACETIPPHLENDITTRSGERRRIAWSNTVLRDSRGGVIGTTSIGEDVTERKRAEEALQKVHRNLKHLLHSSDRERQLIAYEIHDGLAQQLAGAIMQFQAFDHLKDKNLNEAVSAYDEAMNMLQQGHCETRRLIAGVRPPILDESGVVEAIAHLVHQESRDEGPKIAFHSRVDFDRLDPTLENAIYRIAQEGLTNVRKHSKSENVLVSLFQRGDRVRIEIRDWGVGFDPKSVPRSRFGLEGIRQRARLLGGKCSIRSRTGKGTRVAVELPVILRDE